MTERKLMIARRTTFNLRKWDPTNEIGEADVPAAEPASAKTRVSTQSGKGDPRAAFAVRHPAFQQAT
jgi:hypothetical protein